MIPPRLSGFEILEKAGEGGMAVVWKARQLSLDRVVAIKVLPPRCAREVSDVVRFQAEARAAASLKHPGIVQIYDASVEDGVYYFVMEYVAGYTVGAWLRRKGVLQESDALTVAECVADALGYAWRTAGIIHCDIKPDNVMVDADGTVKVADLGLARSLRALASETGDDEIMGTPSYCAPEQARGERRLDCRTDIYALGAMLYHMVTGHRMFEGLDEEAIMDLQVTSDPEDPAVLNPSLSAGICRLLAVMLAKDPRDRFRDWDEVRRALSRLRPGRGTRVSAPPPGSGLPAALGKAAAALRRVPDWIRRYPLAAHAANLLLGLAMVLVLASLLLRRAPPPPPPAEPPGPTPEALALAEAEKRLETARQWLGQHPGEFGESARRLRAVMAAAPGTAPAEEAQRILLELGMLRRERLHRQVMERLEATAQRFVEQGRFEEAARVYESYSGLMEKATESRRLALARDLRRRQRDAAATEAAMSDKTAERLNVVLDGVTAVLVDRGVAAAAARLRELEIDPVLAEARAELTALSAVMRSAAAADEQVLKSFVADVDRTIRVDLKTGPERLRIVAVKPGAIIVAGAKPGEPGRRLDVEDLSERERLSRMAPGGGGRGAALLRSVLALRQGRGDKAVQGAKKADCALSGRLISRAGGGTAGRP
jgi:hypothetical protein